MMQTMRKAMKDKGRKEQAAALTAERAEYERIAAEREKQAQRLRDGMQKRSLLLEARSLRAKAKQCARRSAELAQEARK